MQEIKPKGVLPAKAQKAQQEKVSVDPWKKRLFLFVCRASDGGAQKIPAKSGEDGEIITAEKAGKGQPKGKQEFDRYG